MKTEPTQLQNPNLTIHRIFETLSVVAFILLTINFGYQLTLLFLDYLIVHSYLAWAIPLVVLLSWLGADFLTGLVHF